MQVSLSPITHARRANLFRAEMRTGIQTHLPERSGLMANWLRLGVAILMLGASTYLMAAEVDTPRKIELPDLDTRSISAKITLNGPNGSTKLGFADLEMLGTYRVVTTTFWPEDDGTYSGPLLADVLKQAGLEKVDTILVRAKDGFSQVIPRQDWTKWPIILATRRDGRQMTLRQKGPYRIIYPRNMSAELAEPLYRLRWVWLVESIAPAPKQ